MRALIPAAAVAAAVAIVTAGCGNAGASPGAIDGAASIVPASTAVFVAASTDAQLLPQQPAWAKQLAAALGSEVDVAHLSGKADVVLTQPHDAAKLHALAAKHGLVTRSIGGWTVVAKSSAALDAVASAKSSLADNPRFAAAMSRLPANAVVRAYVDGEEADQLVAALPGQMQLVAVPFRGRLRAVGRRRATIPVTGFPWLAADVHSVKGGLLAEAFAPVHAPSASPTAQSVQQLEPTYTPELPNEIPAGVLAAVDVMFPQGWFELQPNLATRLGPLFGTAAALVPDQLDQLLAGETAVYVEPGSPLPAVTLVTQPQDTLAAEQALGMLQSEVRSGPLKGVQLYHASIGGQFVVSTSQQAIDRLRGGGARLAADSAFVAAEQAAGVPDAVTGFAYANVQDLAPLFGLAGVKLPATLPKLGSVFAYATHANGELRFTAFIGVG